MLTTMQMASYDMNITMKRLTLATIIFMPLTILTGYFGMNFERFDAIKIYSDALYVLIFILSSEDCSLTVIICSFWYVGMPMVLATSAIFMWSDIVDFFQYLQRRLADRQDTKVSALHQNLSKS
jgi:hypothetical protein